MPNQYKLTQPMHPGADRIVIHPMKGIGPHDRLEINGERMTVSSEHRAHESSLPGTVLVVRAKDREVYQDHPAGSVVNVFEPYTSGELRQALHTIRAMRSVEDVPKEPPTEEKVNAPQTIGSPETPKAEA